MSVVGIDLGTTNTVVACVRDGRVRVLADEQGRRLLPSVVSFPPGGEVLVGHAAKARRAADAANTIGSVKRLLGRAWNSPELAQARKRAAFQMREGPGQGPLVVARGQEYTIVEIGAFVLKRAKQIADAALGENIEQAVVTVPAHFNELQRAATKVAARVAGLEVLRIVNEPTAAALAYGLGRVGAERIAVYDFGGGTFDCTLLDLNGHVFEVLATAGDPFLGGDDLDQLIADRMANAFFLRHRHDPRSEPHALERLRQAAEQLKMDLTVHEQAVTQLRDLASGPGGAHLEFEFSLSRRELETMGEPLVARTFKVTEEALALAQLAPTSFDRVVLVGGSSRLPLVRQRVEAFFGAPPMDRMNPDEVVAVGAAIQAAALTEASRRRTIPPPPTPFGAPGPSAKRHSFSSLPALPSSDDEPTSPGTSLEALERASQVPSEHAARPPRTPPPSSLPFRMPPVPHPPALRLATTEPRVEFDEPRLELGPVPSQTPLGPRGATSFATYHSQPPRSPVFTESMPAPLLIDVTPRALVVETVGGFCDVVIPRNAKIPCERTRAFSTAHHGQTLVRVRVAQGEDAHFAANTFLGEVELGGLRTANRGEVSVAVTFELDEGGTLRVRAADPGTGREAAATLQLVGHAKESEILKMAQRVAERPFGAHG